MKPAIEWANEYLNKTIVTSRNSNFKAFVEAIQKDVIDSLKKEDEENDNK